MAKKSHKYQLNLKYIETINGEKPDSKELDIIIGNHDEILNIVDIMRDKNPLGDINESVEFALGLKIFGEVILKNKNNPLFDELAPQFKHFMLKLKSSLNSN